MDEISVLSEVFVKRKKRKGCWRNFWPLLAEPYFSGAGRRKVFEDIEGAKNKIKINSYFPFLPLLQRIRKAGTQTMTKVEGYHITKVSASQMAFCVFACCSATDRRVRPEQEALRVRSHFVRRKKKKQFFSKVQTPVSWRKKFEQLPQSCSKNKLMSVPGIIAVGHLLFSLINEGGGAEGNGGGKWAELCHAATNLGESPHLYTNTNKFSGIDLYLFFWGHSAGILDYVKDPEWNHGKMSSRVICSVFGWLGGPENHSSRCLFCKTWNCFHLLHSVMQVGAKWHE